MTTPVPRPQVKGPMGSGPSVRVSKHPMIHKNMDTNTETIPHFDRNNPPPQVGGPGGATVPYSQMPRSARQPPRAAMPAPGFPAQAAYGGAAPGLPGGQAQPPPPIIVRMDGFKSHVVSNPNARAAAPQHAPVMPAMAPAFAPGAQGQTVDAHAYSAPAAEQVTEIVIPLDLAHVKLCRGLLDDEADRLTRRREAGDGDPAILARLDQLAETARELDAYITTAETGQLPPAFQSAAPATAPELADELGIVPVQTQPAQAPAPAPAVRTAAPAAPIVASPTLPPHQNNTTARKLAAPAGRPLPMVTVRMGNSGPMRPNVRPAKAAYSDVVPTRVRIAAPVVTSEVVSSTETIVTSEIVEPTVIPTTDAAPDTAQAPTE